MLVKIKMQLFLIQVYGYLNSIHTSISINSRLRIPDLEDTAVIQHHLTTAIQNWEPSGLEVLSFCDL